jgi:hypothetical protein
LRLLIDQAHYDGPVDARVAAPTPGPDGASDGSATELGGAGDRCAAPGFCPLSARIGGLVISRERKTTGLDHSRALLERLGWGFTSDRLVELIEQGVRDELTLGDFLELLAESETAFREEKRVKSWLKQSRLPIGRTFESFECLFNRSIDREKIAMLASCEFIRRKETVLLLGPPGTGGR